MSQASGSVASRIVQQIGSKEFRGYFMRFVLANWNLWWAGDRQLGHPPRCHRGPEEGPRVHLRQHDLCPLCLLCSLHALRPRGPAQKLPTVCVPRHERRRAADARVPMG
ncbi:hypothetical protein BC938DRAFT_471881 [Jimgerdemannia flammicorona]|uniref:Uncharacterized protein n=1 Tax=Jimgerdemannia flammicorona TaxID=994334 RepID=A0A433QUI2_9FUNG|nr:hypothetical protein BC938DRAFT_471881 [Jimgerdemannia flammicorona]